MLEILQYQFMQTAIIAGLLASIACGIIGVYVVVKRIVFISGGIAHASFGGIGLGYFLGINPILSVLPFSVLTAVVMGLVNRRTKIAEDTAIGILWAVGMAIGVMFVGLTPGYAPDLMTYLFGNILTVPLMDLYLMAVLDVIIIIFAYLFYKEFLAISFDEEFAEVSDLPVEKLNLLLLCLIALTIVVMIRIVGLILVIALLTIPASISRSFSGNLIGMMKLSICFGAVFTILGLFLSYILDVPSGSTIILVMAAGYLLHIPLRKIITASKKQQTI
ncbi:zinc transport system permease protein [Methanohalophilus levihalophilus]|uniref:metal ABC transporter permease n=1 Tax=Methanohalophilus levihalophilus TaxID=1431282 RepID=UPI001AE2B8D4|nr:metal ABC transporter permease [Methanohalophilus levihalophilus]MBP2029188.1 zinc transport system permease protein [Methanohalophilus levihalophilus]